MTENLFSAFLLAAISGLTFIAYKHPKPFRKNIARPLMVLVVGIAVLIVVYFYGGLSAVVEDLAKEIGKLSGNKEYLLFLVTGLNEQINLIKYAFGVAIAILLYLILLMYLPILLNLPPNSDNK